MALFWVLFSVIWEYFWQKFALFAALLYVLEGEKPIYIYICLKPTVFAENDKMQICHFH